MNRADLLAHAGDHGVGGVADAHDGDAGAKVDQRVAVDVDDHAAAGPVDEDGQRGADAAGDGGAAAGEQLGRARTRHGGHQPALLGEPGPAGEGHLEIGNGGVGHAGHDTVTESEAAGAFGRRIPYEETGDQHRGPPSLRRAAGRRGRPRRARARSRQRSPPPPRPAPRPPPCPRTCAPRHWATCRPGWASGPTRWRRLITAESGKPLMWSRVEVTRAARDLPVGSRGGPAVERGAAAPRHRRRRQRADGASYAGFRAVPSWASRRSTSRSTWSPTRSRRRSRSARPSC